jgi:hypothetical protein
LTSQWAVDFEAPPQALGVIDDMWFRWITDFGLPGADRGKGGKYLLVPPGYDGPLPEGGFIFRKSRTLIPKGRWKKRDRVLLARLDTRN